MNNKYKPSDREKSFKKSIPDITNPNNAVVELIANAYEAGSTEIHINCDIDILNNDLSMIKFEDNGCGMSNKEFKYARNGKGRHAPFAFSPQYAVKTIHNGECSVFEVCKDSQSGFSILEKEKFQTDPKNGTIISFKINNNISVEDIKETITTRFLKNENFKIYLNNNLLN